MPFVNELKLLKYSYIVIAKPIPYRNRKLLSYDPVSNSVLVGRKTRSLTPTETHLLNAFINNPNTFLTRDKLRSQVKRLSGRDMSNVNLRHYIFRLRKKVELNPQQPRVFISKKGVSYMFVDPTKLQEETSISIEEGPKYPQREYSLGEGKIRFYPERYAVMIEGEEVYLTPTENTMLELLVQRGNTVVHHNALEELWNEEGELLIKERKDSVKKYIQKIRNKIGDRKTEEGDFMFIRTRHGFGYMALTDPKAETLSSPTTVFEAAPK